MSQQESKRPFDKGQKLALAATIVASAMAFIDGSIVSIALPAMQQDLGAGFGVMQWIMNGYLLSLGSLILIGGAMGDSFGRKRIFLIGLGIFTLASIGCALAPDGNSLAFARILKGIGAALLVPQSLAIIAVTFPAEIRGRAIGIWAGASALTTALGPPIGGILVDQFDWRIIFWLNIPLAFIAALLCAHGIKESRNGGPARIDWQGGAIIMTALAILTWGLITPHDLAPLAWVAGIGGLVFFWWHQRRQAYPLMPTALWYLPGFTAANLITLLIYGSLGGMMFLLPFDLIERRQYSETEAGLIFLPIGVIIGLLSAKAGHWADKHGPRPLLTGGSFLMAAACALLSLAAEDLVIGIVAPLVIASTGMGLIAAPLSSVIMQAAPVKDSGIASGVNNAVSRIAGLLSIAILGSLATWIYDLRVDTGIPFGQLPIDRGSDAYAQSDAAFLISYGIAMTIAACWCLLSALIAAVWLPKKEG